MLRDRYAIIVQPKYDYDFTKDISEQPDKVDEGDSAFSTGLNAFGGSTLDFALMPFFIKNGLLVRHPYSKQNTGTAPHNDPKATSRDQVLAFFSGILGRTENTPELNKLRAACMYYARSWRVNGDLLSPADRLYLYKCAGVKPPAWLALTGYPMAAANLLWNCYVKPDHEMNQAVVANVALGRLWIKFLNEHHPNLADNLQKYFCGWRYRCEIAYNIGQRYREELNK